jgi:thiol:disulfide interchange protein
MANDSARGRTEGKAPWSRRFGDAPVWGIIALTLVVGSWTLVKGAYYRVAAGKPPASAVAWRSDFDAALVESRSSGKPLLLDFGASWCPPCRVMEHEVWPDREVGSAVNGHYIPVRLDVDDPKAGPLAIRHKVQGIPAIVVVDGMGRELRRAGFMTGRETISFLRAPEGGPERGGP